MRHTICHRSISRETAFRDCDAVFQLGLKLATIIVASYWTPKHRRHQLATRLMLLNTSRSRNSKFLLRVVVSGSVACYRVVVKTVCLRRWMENMTTLHPR